MYVMYLIEGKLSECFEQLVCVSLLCITPKMKVNLNNTYIGYLYSWFQHIKTYYLMQAMYL